VDECRHGFTGVNVRKAVINFVTEEIKPQKVQINHKRCKLFVIVTKQGFPCTLVTRCHFRAPFSI